MSYFESNLFLYVFSVLFFLYFGDFLGSTLHLVQSVRHMLKYLAYLHMCYHFRLGHLSQVFMLVYLMPRASPVHHQFRPPLNVEDGDDLTCLVLSLIERFAGAVKCGVVGQSQVAANPPDRGHVSVIFIGLPLTCRAMRFSRSRVSLPVLPAVSLKLRKPWARIRVPRKNDNASSLVRIPVRSAS